MATPPPSPRRRAVGGAITDNLGSVVAVVQDGGGNGILDSVVYDSYGNIVSQTNSADAMSVGFTGYQYDAESGLYYGNARYYSPHLGRFISEDPSGFAAGDSNLYRYVDNHPTYSTDPTGLYEGGSTGTSGSGNSAFNAVVNEFQAGIGPTGAGSYSADGVAASADTFSNGAGGSGSGNGNSSSSLGTVDGNALDFNLGGGGISPVSGAGSGSYAAAPSAQGAFSGVTNPYAGLGISSSIGQAVGNGFMPTPAQTQMTSYVAALGGGQPYIGLASTYLGTTTMVNLNNQETVTNSYAAGAAAFTQSFQYQVTAGGLAPMPTYDPAGVGGFLWGASLYVPVAGPAAHAIGEAFQGKWALAGLNAGFAASDLLPSDDVGPDEIGKTVELAGEAATSAAETSTGTVGALEDWSNVDYEARYAARDNVWETDNAINFHGNSINSPRTAYLYRLETKGGQFLKWGITQNPATRYSKAFMSDKSMIPWASGLRSNMLLMEREFVETQPGPLNFEPWAGARLGGQP